MWTSNSSQLFILGAEQQPDDSFPSVGSLSSSQQKRELKARAVGLDPVGGRNSVDRLLPRVLRICTGRKLESGARDEK